MSTVAPPLTSPIPLCDLRSQFEPIRDEIHAAIAAVLESQAFILGPEVTELEQQIANYCGRQFAVGCSSGSDALILALMALGIREGDEVITSPFTFFATVGAISRLGARPVFVDIEPDGFNIDANRLAAAVTSRTRAIIPVHLFGQMADMNPILDIARRHDLAVIEDAAQAIGADYFGKRAGSMGDLGCFSFFPSKNLGCYGDGGMVVTNDAKLADKMRVLRCHGAKNKYHHTQVGGNFRLDTLQAAVLLIKLRYLDEWNAARRQHAMNYRQLISDSPANEKVGLPVELPGRGHVYNQFIIRTARRDSLVERFRARKVGTAIYYPLGMHMQECFRELGYRENDFPVTEQACKETCALPMYAELTIGQQNRVVDELAAAVAEATS